MVIQIDHLLQDYESGLYRPFSEYLQAEEFFSHLVMATEQDMEDLVFSIAEEESDQTKTEGPLSFPHQLSQLTQTYRQAESMLLALVNDFARAEGIDQEKYAPIKAYVSENGTLLVEFEHK